MAAFTILRFEKLKDTTAIKGSSGHMMRDRPTPNADEARTPRNRILLGTDDPAADVARRLEGAATRKNSVLAIEVLMSASPEWFQEATKEQRQDWVRQSQAWLVQHFGAENVVHLQVHVDEATPHLTGFIVPRDVSGRLNAARWLDGSKKLADMQTGYTAAVAHLGLQRGIEGSEAKHVSPRTVRGMVEDPKDAKEMRQAANRAVFAERKLREAQNTMVAMRERVAATRDIPLQEVAEGLGLERKKRDPGSWVDAAGEHKISITGPQWFDHKQGRGGGGAIDLAMHVLKTGFREAVAWLGLEMGQDRAARAIGSRAVARASQEVAEAVAEAKPFQAPQEAKEHTRRVVNYLTGRGLSALRVTSLMAQGKLYPDTRANAVFLAVDGQGRARGAEVRGTGARPFHGHATGSSRALPWWFDTAEKPRRLVLCESAIDAMSYAELNPGAARVVSTGGAKPHCPSAVLSTIRAGRWDEVVVAYDNDRTGREMGQRLAEELRAAGASVTVEAPEGKDWNDDLRALAASPPPLSFSQKIVPPGGVSLRGSEVAQAASAHLPQP